MSRKRLINLGVAGAVSAARSAGSDAVPTRAVRARRLPWVELMRRVFSVDVLECPRCQGPMRILATIEQPEVIRRILAHLSLPARAPPAHPPRTDLLAPLAPDLAPAF